MKILDRLPIPDETHVAAIWRPARQDPKRPDPGVGQRPSAQRARRPRRTSRSSRPCWTRETTLGFSMQDRHLREWAGINPGLLAPLANVRVEGQVVGRRRASVWLYPNIPRPAGGGRRPAAVPAEDRQGDRDLRARCRSSRSEVAAAGASRPPRQRPRLVARPGATAHHRANAHLAQAAHASALPVVRHRRANHRRCRDPAGIEGIRAGHCPRRSRRLL